MRLKLSIFLVSCLVTHIVLGQTRLSLVQIDTKLKDTFSFAKQWDYNWDIIKEDNGKFSVSNGRKIRAKDTAHLHYTANCTTNVQGGYAIRYCYGDKIGDTLRLVFSDGLPAYANTFYIYVISDSFYFKPRTIYPSYVIGQKFSYEITNQKLKLNKLNYRLGEIIIGMVDIEFTETFTAPDVDTSKKKYFLKGFIRTPLKKTNTSGKQSICAYCGTTIIFSAINRLSSPVRVDF